MSDAPRLTATVTDWTLEKRTEGGELFEVIKGGDAIGTRVTFRREGLAPPESYASELPLVIEIAASDQATVGSREVST